MSYPLDMCFCKASLPVSGLHLGYETLPAGQDDSLDKIAVDIMHCIRRACDALTSTTPDEFRGAWTAVENCISTFSSTDGEHRTRLTQDDKVITFYIEEQNAALLMYSSKGHVVFEAFEAAPPSQDVLACQDALKWTFPSRAVQISKDDFADKQFQSTLALFLDKASSEYIALFAAKAKKAKKSPNFAMLEPQTSSRTCFFPCYRQWEVQQRSRQLRNASVTTSALAKGTRRGEDFLHTGYAAYKILSCTLLSQLLDDCVHQGMLPALTSLLQKKLGRKLAKLERHHFWECCTEHDKMTSEALIHSIASKLQTSLDVAQQHLQKRLSQFKEATMRKIPALPLQAPDDHRTLSLPSSRRYLDSLVVSTGNQVDGNSNATPFSEDGSLHSNLTLNPAVKNTQAFSRSVLDTLNILADARSKSSSLWSQAVAKMTEGAAEAACDQISATVSVLVSCISKTDLRTVEMRSRILLEIFDQWAILDTICGSLYPTVDDHPPAFPHNLLDVLQLPDVDSMSRLRRVQKHLRHRSQIARYDETVLSNEFGSRFAYESEDLTHLYDRIKQAENVRRQNKTKEWEEACNKYDLLSNSIWVTDL
ncbi:uncharacterized protein SPSK_01548 [Sporothrix schenckii 1099-18]|uniref:DUF6606 domain-containing protein n=1 Tax=Sporothrix schenckii 1099-18 TaxID=1397361 RepID=A0A0F2MEJ0_SPOSC|nr:uncharacterized protein SPSK_01548 [Sporothrix schenckii 1099-18]KJR87489.1 hypothetical protein SPSK_01548 [Sporothrix schenckii 1099-18]